MFFNITGSRRVSTKASPAKGRACLCGMRGCSSLYLFFLGSSFSFLRTMIMMTMKISFFRFVERPLLGSFCSQGRRTMKSRTTKLLKARLVKALFMRRSGRWSLQMMTTLTTAKMNVQSSASPLASPPRKPVSRLL